MDLTQDVVLWIIEQFANVNLGSQEILATKEKAVLGVTEFIQ